MPITSSRLLLVTLVLSASACATVRSSDAKREVVQMEEVVVRAKPDPLTGLDGYDAQQLLEVGNKEYAAAQYDRALQIYAQLVSTFPSSELVPSALYNMGLSYEGLAEQAKAATEYDRIISSHPESPSYKDAYFRKALVLAKIERWTEVADTFWQLRQLTGITPMDELEARVGQGVAMFMQDDYASAEKEFLSALRFHETSAKLEYLPADYWLGQSRFYLGEIAARQFEAIQLTEPNLEHDKWVDMMGKELEEKCDLLLRAQNNFIRAIRIGHTGWATASGYRIGSLYERLYEDLMKVPVPPSLGPDARTLYTEELRNRVRVLVEKAIKIYEQSLAMAQRVGERNEWVERTTKSLERMKSLYLADIQG